MRKPHIPLSLLLLISISSTSIGQKPSVAPTPAQLALTEKPRLKTFGQSLKKYEKNGKDNYRDITRSDSEGEEIIRVKTDLVVSDVLVVNQKGNVVVGLDQDDFVITEDAVPQKMSVFSFGENATIPRSIVLIIDNSSSLKTFLNDSFRATKILVDKLAPQDRMAIVTDNVKVLVDFTKDKTLLKKKLDNLKNDSFGRSKQFSALAATLKEMFDEEDIRPIVIFQTDGDELAELKLLKTDKTLAWASGILDNQRTNFSFEDLCTLVGQSRATIYSIIPGFRFLGLSEEEKAAKMHSLWGTGASRSKKLISESKSFLTPEIALDKVAKLSGGYTDYIERPEDAENVYSNLFTIINHRYLIGYYPTNEEGNGKRRNVKIEVRGHPEYIVTGRKTYFLE